MCLPGTIRFGTSTAAEKRWPAILIRVRRGAFTVHVAPDPRFERDGFDLVHELRLSYPEATLGAKKQVPALEKDPEATNSLKVPAGIQPGETLVIRGAGVPRLNSRGRGDLVCVVQIDVPKDLSRKAKQLIEELREELGKSG